MIYLGQTLALILGILLDALFGEPPEWSPLNGLLQRLIRFLEKRLRPTFPGLETLRRSGLWLSILLLILVLAGSAALLLTLYHLYLPAAILVETLLVWHLFHRRDNLRRAARVQNDLNMPDRYAARLHLSYLDQRDTARLEAHEIAAATVEALALRLQRHFFQPLFYAFFFGVSGGLAGRALFLADDTLQEDRERNLRFGYYPALFRVVMQELPARLTARLLVAAAWIRGQDWKAARQELRNIKEATQPEALPPMAALAGALGIVLGGPCTRKAEKTERPLLGQTGRQAEPDDIQQAAQLLNTGALLAFALALLLRTLFLLLLFFAI